MTAEPEEDFGPDLLCDPDFVPCRNESCKRRELHRAHPIESSLGRKIHRIYDKCPDCQTALVVTKTRRERSASKRTRDITEAKCPNPDCGYTHTKAFRRRA